MVKIKEAGSNTIKKSPIIFKDSLILKINCNQQIIKFNAKCQQITGYEEDEILNKDIFGTLIPDRYKSYWNDFINSKNKTVDDLKIPLITKNGHEIMISWASFPVKNQGNNNYDVNLVGNVVSDWNDFIEKNVSRDKRNISEKYDTSLKLVSELKQINLSLEKKNQELEKDLNKLEGKLKKKSEEPIVEPGKIVNKSLYSVSELFGGKKKRQEYENMMRELDEREKILNKIENKLVDDKKKINEQIIEFKKWRQRLEQLENELENRKKLIDRQEKLMMDEITDTKDTLPINFKDELPTNQDIFDKIPGCAAIIQRGILKKVNDSFAELIGYNVREIIDKSLFDFIGPEGFSDIERFYFNRLKGEDAYFYQTVLVTKDNNQINVEVVTKPTFFNGEKADIAVVKKVDLTDNDKN